MGYYTRVKMEQDRFRYCCCLMEPSSSYPTASTSGLEALRSKDHNSPLYARDTSPTIEEGHLGSHGVFEFLMGL